MNKKIALALCSLMAAGVLLPAAQAAHYTLYNDPANSNALHHTMGSFELTTSDQSNRNGPALDDTRAVPADADVPTRFRGLADTLTSGITFPGASGTAILDHNMYGSAVEAGAVLPYNYFVGAAGTSRTTPTSMHAMWAGYWIDSNSDGVINDEWCGSTNLNCPTGAHADEFVWRGANTGEALSGLNYIFPGDYDGSVGTGDHTEPSGLAGDCARYTDNTGCINPGPDMPYADSTTSAANADNQRWAGENGGGQWTPEEFLVVSQHVVSVLGPASLAESATPEQYAVDGTTAQGVMRDYDFYQSLAGGTVESLYLSTMRGSPRDAQNIAEQAIAQQPNVCPTLVLGGPCTPNTAHLDAQAVGASGLKGFVGVLFAHVVPAYASTPGRSTTDYTCARAGQPDGTCPAPATQGFYGDFLVTWNNVEPYSDVVPGGVVRPRMEAWLWDDQNGDGYIGEPSAIDVTLYGMGLNNDPNNGECTIGSGILCEQVGRADIFDGADVKVSPGAAGWPPGTLVLRSYETPWPQQPFGPGQPFVDASTPLFGTNAVTLQADTERCALTYLNCRTLDALFIPTGSVLTLNGQINGASGVDLTWVEGTNSYNLHHSGTWTASF